MLRSSEFRRMPFGLKNAPATFQRLMDCVLRELLGQGVFVYLDDIVIYAETYYEHEGIFNRVLSKLRSADLKLQVDKCEFLRHEVNYLGHVISRQGLSPDPKKLEAGTNFPRPKDVKNVKQFLRLAGYYRMFIKDFAQIAKPLTRLLENETNFVWEEKPEEAFLTLREALCSAPVLQYPDFVLPFIITTDASGFAIGGILTQVKIGKDRPIAYTSTVLGGAEPRYDTYEKEALAIIHSVKTFRAYIYGRHFTIISEHKPLVWFKSAEVNTRVQKWRFKLSKYDYDVEYKPGKLNANADAHSLGIP